MFPGDPASQNTKLSSNILKPLMIDIVTTKIVTGFSIGNVMYRNFWKIDAPSISDASYNSFGIFCKPAKKYSILTPSHRHTDRKSTRLNSSHVAISYAV